MRATMIRGWVARAFGPTAPARCLAARGVAWHVGRVAARVAGRIAARVLGPIAARRAAPLASHLRAPLASPSGARIGAPIAAPVGAPIAWRAAGALAALALAATAALAQEPPRQPDGTLAVPALARVADLAGLLSAADRARLETQLAAFEARKGTQVAVLIVPSTKPEPIADFAQRVGDVWKIGRKGVGDGVLMAVAVQDRQIWFSVALALEGAIPDVTAARISREIVAPRFREGRYADGIANGLNQIFRQIEGERLPEPVAGASGDDTGDLLVSLLPLLFGGAVIGSGLRRAIGAPGALLASGAAGGAAWLLAGSLGAALLLALAVLLLSFGAVQRASRSVGGRRGGGFTPGGWSGGSGQAGGGGWSGGGGGWSSGGGGNFSGGGGGSSW